jgi:hypothetical protein
MAKLAPRVFSKIANNKVVIDQQIAIHSLMKENHFQIVVKIVDFPK